MIVNGYKGFFIASLGDVGWREVGYRCSRAQCWAQSSLIDPQQRGRHEILPLPVKSSVISSYLAGVVVVVVVVVDVELGGALTLPLLWASADSLYRSTAWPLRRILPCSLVCAAASPCVPPTLISPGTLLSPVVKPEFILTVYWNWPTSRKQALAVSLVAS